MRLRLVLLTIFMFAPLALSAADAPKKSATPVPAPPPLRDGTVAVEPPEGTIEPEITITTKGTEIHEEYRANGRLYMIKITPAKGKPYYLIDHEGSGQFRRSDFETRISIPTWVIKRF